MPLDLSPKTKLDRARQLIAECRAMPEPPMGQAHGHWKVKMRSRLARAAKLIESKRCRARDDFNDAERAEAQRLFGVIDQIWPK